MNELTDVIEQKDYLILACPYCFSENGCCFCDYAGKIKIGSGMNITSKAEYDIILEYSQNGQLKDICNNCQYFSDDDLLCNITRQPTTEDESCFRWDIKEVK